MPKKDRFCIAPFVALNTRGDKSLRVCCSIMDMFYGIPRDGTIEDLAFPKKYRDNVYDLSSDSIEEIWNSRFMRDLRTKMINGEYVSNCSHCHQLEDRGLTSKRISKNQRYLAKSEDIIEFAKANEGKVPKLPQWWEIRLSTQCNLACRMCTPGLSSKMRSEYRKNFDLLHNEEARYSLEEAERRAATPSLAKNDFFLQQIEANLDDIDVLEMRGGEVLSDKRSISFIEDISSQTSKAKNIEFDLSTNVTLLNVNHIEIFNRFKGGSIRSSIDAFGEENEYIRHNSKWQTIVDALYLQKNLHAGYKRIIQITLQAYQVYTIDKLLWFIDELIQDIDREIFFGASTTKGTPHLVLELVPVELRLASAKKIQNFIDNSYMCNRSPKKTIHLRLTKGIQQAVLGNEQPPASAIEEFRKYTKSLDRMRNQDCLSIFPHLAPMFANDYLAGNPQSNVFSTPLTP